MSSPFDAEALIGDLTVTLDIDVLIGRYPQRDGPIGDPAEVRATLKTHRITAGAVANLRAALFDASGGNDDILALAGDDVVPVGAVDLRDGPPAVGSGRQVGGGEGAHRLAVAGAQRLFQRRPPTPPG